MVEKKQWKRSNPFPLFLLANAYPGITIALLTDRPDIAGLFGEQAGK